MSARIDNPPGETASIIRLRSSGPLASSLGVLLEWISPYRELIVLIAALAAGTTVIYDRFTSNVEFKIYKCVTDARIVMVESSLEVERLRPGAGGALTISPVMFIKVDDINLTEEQRRDRTQASVRETMGLLISAHVKKHQDAHDRIKQQLCPALVDNGDF